jgi:hypothetical protein
VRLQRHQRKADAAQDVSVAEQPDVGVEQEPQVDDAFCLAIS